MTIYKKLKATLFSATALFMTAMIMIISMAFQASAANVTSYTSPDMSKRTSIPYPYKIDTDSLTGNPRKDIVTIARSQLGYSGTGNKSSYMASCFGTNYSNWCSEFATWCAKAAGMPDSIFPTCTESISCTDGKANYIYRFTKLGQVYYVKESPKIKSYKGYSLYPLSVDDIQSGDIILITYNGTRPSHTCLCYSVDKSTNTVKTIDGNHPNKVTKNSWHASNIFAVVRPAYELYPLKGMKIAREENGYHLSWKKREGVDGYNVYRSTKKDGSYKLVKKLTSESKTEYTDHIEEGNYYYKVVPYEITRTGKTITGKGFENVVVLSSAACAPVETACSHIYIPYEKKKAGNGKKNTVIYTCTLCGDSYTAHDRK